MTPSAHVAELIQHRNKVDQWLKWFGGKDTCCQCDERGEYPWVHEGQDALICDTCHPKCEEPGCEELALLGGEGGCEHHEASFWVEFQTLVEAVA